MNKGSGVQSQGYQVITKKYGALARPKKKTTYKTKQLYMASQQVNRSTTSQVVEARELKICMNRRLQHELLAEEYNE